MRKGKMVAQGAHACAAVILEMEQKIRQWDEAPGEKAYRDWISNSFTKVCVSVNSLEELTKIYEEAKAKGIPCSLIQDAGLTEFGGVPTYTAAAVGPDYEDKINPITGLLPLL